jgi:hypothetical protein
MHQVGFHYKDYQDAVPAECKKLDEVCSLVAKIFPAVIVTTGF